MLQIFKKKNEHVITSKCFLEEPFFRALLVLHIKKEEVWSDGTHPILFAESSCVCMPSFRPVAPFFFSGESTNFWFLF